MSLKLPGNRAKPWHAQQHLGVLVFGYFLADQRIESGEFLVQGQNFPGESGDDPLPHVLGRNDGVLGFCRLYGGCGNCCRGTGAVLLRPRVDPGLACPADPVRPPVFSEQQQ